MADAPDTQSAEGPASPAYLIASWRDDSAGVAETVAHDVNRRASECAGCDIALVLADVELPEGWLDRLRTAASQDSTAATVCPTALPGDSLLATNAVAGRSTPWVLDVAGLAPGAATLAPRAGLVTGPCVLLKRSAFDLLGGLDETLPTSASAIAAFGFQAQAVGLANLLAPGLAVAGERTLLSDADTLVLARRFPNLWEASQEPPSAAVERRLGILRGALGRPSVTIDARALGAGVGGTQVYVRELLRALAADERIRVRALIGTAEEAREIEDLGRIETMTYKQALESSTESDLVHRPQQVFTVDDLNLLRPLGRRLVITHLDLIAFHNPTYFSEISHWRRHVRATRIALSAADHVVFFSEHARVDALREDLVDGERTSVVPAGADDQVSLVPDAQPSEIARLDTPFILCLGTDYAHKNRPFALELTDELRRNHGWNGTLVLAGQHVANGSSAAVELMLIESREGLAEGVLDLGVVSDLERRWLMSHASALVYPTVLEGFGLVPLEAAIAGVPCLFAAQSSLAEILDPRLATIEPWDVARSARRAVRLLHDDSERARHVAELQSAARRYTWEACVDRTIDAYRHALDSRARSSARGAWEAFDREHEIVRLDEAVQANQARLLEVAGELDSLRDSLSHDALALVGPDGLLGDRDQRALLALAARERLRGPLFTALRAGYRMLHRAGPTD